MAHTDKNIVITPHSGNTTNDPRITFSGANASVNAQTVSLFVYADSGGRLSLEGSAGQLFSVTNNLKGSIFSVNDVSGIPSIEVIDDGTVKFAQYNGNVLIGTAVSKGDTLHVNGPISVNSRNSLKFYDTDSSHFVALRSNTSVSTNVTWNLPNTDGSSNEVLSTDGAGNLKWQSAVTGYTGSQGVIGYTGSQGIQGVIGYTGSQGIQGVIGYTGSQGIQGVIGYTGSQGIQGVIGYTGSQGIQGVIGYTGSQGIQGVIGYTGSQGIQGVIGYTGSQGVIGYTGSRSPTVGYIVVFGR
jgi:hypothetical protein